MFDLRTLGTLDLIDSAGLPVDSVLAQSKRSLLLAYLACAIPTGYHRRDVLLALFWPELDTERARAALRKAIHFLRAALGDAVVTRGDEVRVDFALLRCDVVEMGRAESEGRLADALALYVGEFLPGVYLKDAPNLERWIQRERLRHSASAARMAWALADSSLATDPAAAMVWVERAAALTPDDESSLRRRMTLLRDAGATALALRAYEDFATNLSRDLDGALPSLPTQQLYQGLRAPRMATGEVPVLSYGLQPAPVAIPVEQAAPEVLGAPIKKRLRWQPVLALTSVGVIAIAAAYLAGHSRSGEVSAMSASSTGRTIAVMPFTVRGDHVDYLREGMVDLLSMSLEGAGDITTIDPTVLLGFLANDDGQPDEMRQAQSVARHFGAGSYIKGTVVNAGGQLHVRVSLYPAGSMNGIPTAIATAVGPESQLAPMIDNLTREVVAGVFTTRSGRLSRLAAQTTTSLSALKSYLSGAQMMRVGQYGEATQAFRAAIASDSSFALAYYGLSLAVGWASEGTDREATVAAEAAVRHTRGLSPHDSLLLVAHLHSWNGSTREAEQEYRQLVAAYPSDPDAWHELGEVIFHNGSVSGQAMSDARDAFARTAGVESLRISALAHIARIDALERNALSLDTIATLAQRSVPNDPRVVEITNLAGFLTSDSAQRARAIAATRGLSDRGTLLLAREIATYTGAWPDAEAVALPLTAASRPSSVRALGWVTIAEVRAAAGQPAGAREALANAALIDARQAATARGFLAALPFLPASDAELSAAREELVRWATTPPPPDATSLAREVDADEWTILIAAIDVRAGRTPLVSGEDDRKRTWLESTILAERTFREPPNDARVARSSATILGTRWKVIQETGMLRTEGLIRFARARLLRQAGEPVEADRWYSTFPAYGRSDAIYRAPVALERARAREAQGDLRGAARLYADVAFLWRLAEPELQPLVKDAAQRASRLLK